MPMPDDAIQSFQHVWIDKKSPRTLLLLHGTGADEHDLIPLGGNLDPAANILSPRGRVDEHGMTRFFRRISDFVFDEDSIRFEVGALSEFLRAAAAAYGFGLEGTVAVGYSNGANTAASLLLLHPESIGSILMIRGSLPLEPSPMPDLSGKKVLLLNGEIDRLISLENAHKFVELARGAGASVEQHILPAGHEITRQDYVLMREWLGN